MPEVILKYHARENTFWFEANSTQTFSGLRKIKTPSGAACAFSGAYPTGYVGLSIFKGLYPEGKASTEALEQIKLLKEVKEHLAVQTIVNAHQQLFRVSPYAHQKTAIEYMLHYDRLALLLEQGLGKTFISCMAIRIAKEMGTGHKTVVVCPPIVVPAWSREAAKATDLRVVTYYGDPKERAAQRPQLRNSDWDILVTTFNMLTCTEAVSRHTLLSMWDSMGTDSQTALMTSWAQQGVLTKEALAELSSGNVRVRGKILSTIPMKHLPWPQLHKAKADANNQLFLLEIPFDTLIVDEASRVLNHATKRSLAVEALAAKARRTYLLSGTLCVGRPTDMFMPFRILDGGILGTSWTAFTKEYCVPSRTNKHIFVGYKNLDRIKLRTEPYILAMNREDCLDLPNRVMTQRYYELTDKQRRLYNQVLQQDKVMVAGKEVRASLAAVKINKLLQIQSGFIVPSPDRSSMCDACNSVLACVERNVVPFGLNCVHRGEAHPLESVVIELGTNKLALLEEDLEDSVNEKIIIWAWYRHDLAQIAGLLQTMRIPFVSADTRNCEALFENDDRIRVFLGQTKQGIGITLNSASCTIYYSHGADMEARLQSMDRNYRIGQGKPIIVKDYICSGTVEENLVYLLQHKERVKDFMQLNISCASCANFSVCSDSAIEFLDAGCLYTDEKNAAERKISIRMQTI